jgi:hypothetical protein
MNIYRTPASLKSTPYMTRMHMRVTIGAMVVALTLAGATAPVAAQQSTTATLISAENQRVARGLEAQFQAALIKERRLADDRELRIIAAAEDRLRQARAAFDRKIKGAEAELEAARAAYAKLVAEIALRDVTARAKIEAYRQEALNLARHSSPDLIAAYQRFADGDQEAAWPVMKALTEAESRARRTASDATSAAQWRQLARSRETMRLSNLGGATTQEVLSIWDEAAALDPNDVWTHIQRVRLALPLGLIEEAQVAANQAMQVAVSLRDKAAALDEIGSIQEIRDPDAALKAYSEALRISRDLLPQEGRNVEGLRDVSVSLDNVGRIQETRDPGAALKAYEESLRNCCHRTSRCMKRWRKKLPVPRHHDRLLHSLQMQRRSPSGPTDTGS